MIERRPLVEDADRADDVVRELSAVGLLAAFADSGVVTPTTLSLSSVFEGIDLQGEDALDRWEAIGRFLGRVHRSCKWWIGAWLNWGEGAFGERWAQAEAATGLSKGYLENIASIERKIAPSRRRENLSFSTHGEVAALPPSMQTEILDRAEREELSQRDVRQIVKDTGLVPPREQPQWSGDTDSADVTPLPPADVLRAATLVWKRAKRNGDEYTVPADAMAQLAAAIGRGE